MPKGHRSVRSQGYYRLSPGTTPTTQYAPISARTSNIPNTYYNSQQGPLTNNNMSQQSYSQGPSGYVPNGGPVQHPLATSQYASMPPAQQVSIRPSSGAWTPQDDQTLMVARAQGMNWAPIQQAYFPTKTPNACRKRHERLMERRSADDWDGLKLENLAKNYMGMRKEIWSSLAAQTGEKWHVVEQKVLTSPLHLISLPIHIFTSQVRDAESKANNNKKCMSQGLKNLQTAARSCARRERLLDPTHAPTQSQGSYNPGAFEQHTDDSGYADDIEPDYDADGASDRSSNGYQGHYHSHSNGSNGSMGGGSMGGGMGGMGGNMMTDPRFLQQHQHQPRLPSLDMGIDAIINRQPPGGR